jgi:hypothetical protein
MILLFQVFIGTTLFSLGFVVGCFWSTNFVRDRMERNNALGGGVRVADPQHIRSNEPVFSFVGGERTSGQ